jgi:type II secretory pathway predicted ATPase ExeA
MYEQYYGLREKPFSLAPDPSFLYLARRHQHALTMLEYVLGEASSFALITGEVGCGKTTVVRHVLESVELVLNVGFVTNTHTAFGTLLPWILEALGLGGGADAPSEQYRRLVEHARNEYTAGRRLVLVVDEAQNLGIQGLEELRVLSNINEGKRTLIQTILIGQPELRRLLQRRSLRQFAQRIAMEYHLEPLQPEETHSYIAHRLAVAGGSGSLFSPGASAAVHTCTGGVPRLINIVCDTALVYGFADRKPSIDAEIIEQVLHDRAGVLPLMPATRQPAPALAG